MTVLVYAAIAVGAVVFVAATAARAVMYARNPIHLRWEIYPVPQGRRGQLVFMVPEILFLKGLWEANRRLWFRSFPFHLGLYLISCAGASLLVVAACVRLFGIAWMSGAAGQAAGRAIAAAGWSGVALSLLGSLALLHRRLSDPALRAYTTAGDIFNLLFFAVALGTLGAGYLARPGEAPGALAIVMGVLSWDSTVAVSPLLGAGLVLTSALAAYIPLTHMSHFIAKYFTYHAVRWDDAPLGRDPKIAAQLAEYLTYRPTWTAGHIRTKEGSTWAEVVTTNPAGEGRR